MITVTRKEHFNAAHRLFREDLTDEENLGIFGKCSNPNWHGHNYTLYVTVKGGIREDTGFVVDLRKLSSLIQEIVISKLDHKNINLEVDFMKGILPTTENLACAIFNQLKPWIEGIGAEIHSVKIEETEKNSAEYTGL